MAKPKDGALREEVYNTYLALILREEYLNAVEERRTPRGGRPDVMVDLDGSRVLIEAKYKSQGAEKALYQQTQERMEQDASIAVAAEVIYPAALRTAAAPDRALRRSNLCYRFRWQNGEVDEWQKGKPSALADALYALRNKMDTPKRLQEAVQIMTDAVGEAALELGLRKADGERIAGVVNVRDVESGRKIAALMVLNALVFQSHLAESNKKVNPLDINGGRGEVAKHWQWICDEIDYVPIFRTAADVLRVFPEGRLGESILALLVKAAGKIRDIRGHDLAGRVFHQLVDFAKPRAAYYTSLPAGTLLSSLAFNRKLGGTLAGVDWSNLEAVGKLRVADLACGTGTLLLAAAREVERLHRNFCGGKNKKHQPQELHRVMMESVLHGYDVELIAVHLAAAHLGLLSPQVAFDRMNLYALPCGSKENGAIALGSAPTFPRAPLCPSALSWPPAEKKKTKRQTTTAATPLLCTSCAIPWVNWVPHMRRAWSNPPSTTARRPQWKPNSAYPFTANKPMRRPGNAPDLHHRDWRQMRRASCNAKILFRSANLPTSGRTCAGYTTVLKKPNFVPNTPLSGAIKPRSGAP